VRRQLLCAKSLAASLVIVSLASASFADTIRGTVHASGVRSPEGVVVYIERIPGASFAPPKAHAVIEQTRLLFIPHVLPILVGTTVDFHNGEEPTDGRAIQHNVFSPPRSGAFNLGTYAHNQSKPVLFDKPGTVTVLCNVHPEMSAYVVVLETPYFAVTDREGAYRITDVPAGDYVVKTWHPSLRQDSRSVFLTGETVVDFRLSR